MSRTTLVRVGTVLVLATAGALGYLVHTTGGAGAPAAPHPSSTVPGDTVPAVAAATQLSELRVAPRGSMTGYSDAQFPHWTSQGHGCDTRDVVLQREGRGVVTGPQCTVKAGTWTSPYDGKSWTRTSDVDIDHLVPRGNAWISGASSWTLQRRTEFANDLSRPELVAVTDNINEAKGDQAPDTWKPPLSSDWCGYATDWIAVKHYYQLIITHPEHDALATMLGTCGKQAR
jgi:hypothetical protein